MAINASLVDESHTLTFGSQLVIFLCDPSFTQEYYIISVGNISFHSKLQYQCEVNTYYRFKINELLLSIENCNTETSLLITKFLLEPSQKHWVSDL